MMTERPEEAPAPDDWEKSSWLSGFYRQISGFTSALGVLATMLTLLFAIMIAVRPDPAVTFLRRLEQAIATSDSQSAAADACADAALPPATPCETIEVTREVEVFVVVTATPQPEAPTEQPTIEPTHTPTSSVQLPYMHNFDGSLGPEWEVLRGIPIIAAGELSGPQDDELIVAVGDASWENYTVEIDFINLSDLGTVTFTFGQQTQFFATLNVEKWSLFDGNEWVVIESCSGCGIGRNGRLRIETAEGQYVVYVDGQIHKQLSFGQDIAGPLSIRITRRARLDNLLVSPPN
jgi:hypothetical protein